ncbi:MAG: DUF1826 domain-containing protein [Rhodobacteraceae bacterium]|nr:DUF1826 domain-containing protein [Paracoccaceae bacterium]
MTVARAIKQDSTIPFGIAETPEGLSAIHQPGCAATIWRRSPLPCFQSWIDGLAPEQLPKTRVILSPDRVCDALLEITKSFGMPDCDERTMLVEDVSALAAIFAEVMDAAYLRLRLGAINNNACREFHIDAVTARLVCTYRGTGTQYGFSTDGAEPPRIFTVPTGAPIVLRGTLWPEHPRSGLLHRSPPIEGTGETRLVLVLDPITDPHPEPDPEVITRH